MPVFSEPHDVEEGRDGAALAEAQVADDQRLGELSEQHHGEQRPSHSHIEGLELAELERERVAIGDAKRVGGRDAMRGIDAAQKQLL